MKSALRFHHQAFILILILFIHGGMLITFMLVQFQSEPHEAIVMMEQEQNEIPDRDWVAMNNSLPHTQFIAQDGANQQHASSQNQEQQNRQQQEKAQEAEQQSNQSEEIAAQEKQIDDAIAVASEVLEKKMEKKEEEKKEPAPSPKAETDSNASKPSITLAQLTQGFVEHIQHHNMTVRSKKTGQAGIDQIKHINYCQKILQCIVNSYKINTRGVSKKMLENRARIQLALNRDGSIAHLSLQESSGDAETDSFLLTMFRDASSSFPPVPAALQEDPYSLPTFSVDSLESFRSEQGWYIDN